MGRTGTPVGKNPYHPFPASRNLVHAPVTYRYSIHPVSPCHLLYEHHTYDSYDRAQLATIWRSQPNLIRNPKRPLASQDSEQIMLVLSNLNSARLSDHFEDDSPSPILISKYGSSEPWNATFFHEKIAMHWMCVSPNSYALDIFAAEARCHETRALGFSSWSPFHHRKLGIP